MTRKVAALGLAAFLAVSIGFSQVGEGVRTSKGLGHYDKATETTIRGSVEDVMTPTKNRWAQVRLSLKSNEGTFEVHLGPSAYISSQRFSFAKGDTIEVVGSKLTINDKDALIARQITKNGKVLNLRDREGFPVFAHRERQSSHTEDE